MSKIMFFFNLDSYNYGSMDGDLFSGPVLLPTRIVDVVIYEAKE